MYRRGGVDARQSSAARTLTQGSAEPTNASGTDDIESDRPRGEPELVVVRGEDQARMHLAGTERAREVEGIEGPQERGEWVGCARDDDPGSPSRSRSSTEVST